MGSDVSCFSPADEDYELAKTHFHPNPRTSCDSNINVNFPGRNTNSNPQGEEQAAMMHAVVENTCAEEMTSGAHGDIAPDLNRLPGDVTHRSDYSKDSRQSMAAFRGEQLGYSMNPNNVCARYTMFVRNVNNSFVDVDRILSQRLLSGLQRRYGCRMEQHNEVALFRGNEVRVVTIDGPSRSHICKFRSALPVSLTKYLITGVNHSADVDDVLDTN